MVPKYHDTCAYSEDTVQFYHALWFQINTTVLICDYTVHVGMYTVPVYLFSPLPPHLKMPG